MKWLTHVLGFLAIRSRDAGFTPRAQQALAIARKIALDRKKSACDTDDLLSGMCALGEGAAFDALSRLRVKPAEILLHFGVTDGWRKQVVPSEFAYSDSVKVALALAMRESKSMRSGSVGTDHILSALVDRRSGSAGDYLAHHEISRTSILEKLSEIQKDGKSE